MNTVFVLRNTDDCRKVGDLVYDALRIGFDVAIAVEHPEQGGRLATVTLTDPPEVTAKAARLATPEQNRAGLHAMRSTLNGIGTERHSKLCFDGEVITCVCGLETA